MNIGDRVPAGEDFLVRRLQELERKVARMESARTLDLATITAEAGLGIRTGDFDGTDFAHPGTAGNYFGGDGLVANRLKLRPGSVDNAALTNPVRGDVTRAMTTGFALTTAMSTLTSTTWNVPAGFNTVAVFVLAKVFAYNPTAGLDYLQAMARVTVPSIQDIDGGATGTAVSGSNGSGTSIGIGVAVFTGLADTDQVIVKALGQSSFGAWAANTGNYAEISGSLTWYRT